jgi:hypothetical protein
MHGVLEMQVVAIAPPRVAGTRWPVLIRADGGPIRGETIAQR